MNKNEKINSLIIIISAIISTQVMPVIWQLFSPIVAPYVFHNQTMLNLFHNAFMLLPLLIVANQFFPQKSWYALLGMTKNYKAALTLALIATLPMFIGYSLLSSNLNASFKALLDESFRPGFFEEVIFRGFIFGLLFRYCRWGFIPAAVFASLLLGLTHDYQADDMNSMITTIMFSILGGVWFAWLYAEADFNLWLPIFLHGLMNYSVALHDIGGGIALSPQTNLFRMMTIVLTVVFTIIIKRQRGFSTINKSSLWRQQAA